MRWFVAALLALVVVAAGCGDGKSAEVPSASTDSQAWCDAVRETAASPSSDGGARVRKLTPPQLKDDLDKFHVNNDPDGIHLDRLREFARKACAFDFLHPNESTSVTTTSTSAPR
jgi:hypothetical protein